MTPSFAPDIAHAGGLPSGNRSSVFAGVWGLLGLESSSQFASISAELESIASSEWPEPMAQGEEFLSPLPDAGKPVTVGRVHGHVAIIVRRTIALSSASEARARRRASINSRTSR